MVIRAGSLLVRRLVIDYPKGANVAGPRSLRGAVGKSARCLYDLRKSGCGYSLRTLIRTQSILIFFQSARHLALRIFRSADLRRISPTSKGWSEIVLIG